MRLPGIVIRSDRLIATANFSERQLRWFLGTIGVGSFLLLLAIEILTDSDDLSLLDIVFDAITLLLTIGGAVGVALLIQRVQGSRWVYEGDGETITVTVKDETKLIEDVTCVVVNDRVEEDGDVVEDTDDWYAQDLLGNVWYCGEIAQNFEIAEGEDTPELVDVDGSWKAFRDFARPGIIMFAAPGERIDETYRQEFALREAEDVAQIVLRDGTATVPAASCPANCLVNRDFTPIDPDVEEYKYYAPGVGLILEVGQDGSRVELVEFTR